MGSNPIWTVDGGIGEGVNTLVCGSSMRGFDSHIPPHNGGLAQLGEHLPYKQEVTGSSPVSSIESLAQLVEHLTCNQRVGSSSLPRLIGPEKTQAGVAELADALDLGSSVFGRVGSSPTTRTMPI